MEREPHMNLRLERCLCSPNSSEAIMLLGKPDETYIERIADEDATLVELPFSDIR